MNRNTVFCLSLFCAVAALLMAGCMSSTNMSRTVSEGTLQTGVQLSNKVQDPTDTLQDAGISSAVRTIFANDEMLSRSNIHVDTSHRSVTLSGTVTNGADAYRALRLVRSVDEVKSVHSLLVVR